MNDEVAIMILGFVLVGWRLERLGKQLEAVCNLIIVELTPSEDRKRELNEQRKELKEWERKDRQQSFIFWAVVIAGAIAWGFFRHSN